MVDQTRYRKYEVYDFVSKPIGLAAGSSTADGGESTPPIPSFYGGPDRATQMETRRAPAPRSEVPAGWYPDPARRHQQRFWDGFAWTGQVADAGVLGADQAPPAA